ncbi:MAG: hypothetical protein KatS3mg057_1594 [Herpetosiphonaceae bacterium]|nr:MAG: hypothetical protein KatS3mg057_1594 [Herpetosiphonaceae bacterium]
MIAGVLLAAGASTRLGRPKQLLDWRGIPLVRHVAQQALGSRLDTLYVVVGAHAEKIAAALENLPVVLIRNEHYAEGQSTSLRAGIAALPPQTQLAIMLLVDQPFVTSTLINRLIDAADACDAQIIAPQIAGRRANPVLFKAPLFPALLEVQGDQGARQVIAAYRQQTHLIPVEDPALGEDIDTLEDYERLRRQTSEL